MIKENLNRVQENIRNACARAGRKEDEVTLIAVSKTKPVSMLEEAYALGVRYFGENKVQELVDKAGQLPEEISKEAVKHGVTANILIEVNVAGEESKFGVSPEDTPGLIEEISRLPAIQVRGLMTIAPFVEKAEDNRIIFNALLKLYVDISRKKYDNVTMAHLSMGMSGDYPDAIVCGSTMVRVGTAIFGPREYCQK